MGECNYYLKARFRSEADAATAEPLLAALLGEGARAYQYWQDSRPHPLRHKRGWHPPSNSEFWDGFREKFPLVMRYLRELAGTADWDNGLSGILGCLIDPLQERTGQPNAVLWQYQDTLFLELNGIWHGTTLNWLERYCREELGAVAVGSISEEDFELPEDSDWELDPHDAFDAIDI
jgi:hypothetical protein